MDLPPTSLPLRVLVVEDYTDGRESTCLLVQLWGHAREAAPDGRRALEMAAMFRPDVVLMDIGLPGLDGYQTARAMRNLSGLEGAVFAALTGYGSNADVRRSHAEAFAAHFTKPCEPDELKDFLRTVAAERAGLKLDAPA